MSALELTQIGNSAGVILPKEVLASMNVGKGDTVYLTQAAHAGSRNGQAAGPRDVRVSRCCNAAASHARGTSTKHPLRNGFSITSRRATSDIQNRKYRCAIGSSFAGSQVSRWPSARTA
jgi:hypothetical protein